MAAFARIARSNAQTAARRTLFTDSAHLNPAEAAHNDSGSFYRNVTMFVAIPACLALAVKIFGGQHAPAPERKEWSHLNIQKKKFPWGDGTTSLFYNPETQGGSPPAAKPKSQSSITQYIAAQMPSNDEVFATQAELVNKARDSAEFKRSMAQVNKKPQPAQRAELTTVEATGTDLMA
eukprot:TRINITY_DN8058_c0_g1_i2.p1 TRINITY_DN8058_c0_g1~~TRINITY_DN8058_c0_g1_i2.p1  ORF type:complete len:178 (+),score=39.16 TRINITY_DN8058_c0_g1_i2:2-535(+)